MLEKLFRDKYSCFLWRWGRYLLPSPVAIQKHKCIADKGRGAAEPPQALIVLLPMAWRRNCPGEAGLFRCLTAATFGSWQWLVIKAVWWMSSLISLCSLCLLIRDLLDSGIREVLCSPCCAVVRQAEGPRPAGWLNAGRYWASKALLSLIDPSAFPVPQCLPAALGQAKPSSPAAQRGQELRWSLYIVAPPIRARSPSSQDGAGTDGWQAGWSLHSPWPGARPVPVAPPGPGLRLRISAGGVAY